MRYLSRICLNFLFFALRFCYRKVEIVTTCSRLKRALVVLVLVVKNDWYLGINLYVLIIVFFLLRRGSVLMAKMETTGMTRRTKEEIEIHEELMLFNNGDTTRSKF